MQCKDCEYNKETNLFHTEKYCMRLGAICGLLGCGEGIPKVKTNADRIRIMTDEELASVITDDWCEIICSGTDYLCDGTCEQHVLKWLKEEAGETDG